MTPASSSPPIGCDYSHIKAFTIPQSPVSGPDGKALSPQTLALAAIGWLMGDTERAERYMALTGLYPDALRNGLADDAVLASILEFLTNYEPDLIKAAEALATTPEELVAAHRELAQ